jgi:hypothetical protein
MIVNFFCLVNKQNSRSVNDKTGKIPMRSGLSHILQGADKIGLLLPGV